MINVNRTFDMAQLAEASYVLFHKLSNYSDEQVRQSLQNEGELNGRFSASQAAEFVKHWKVAHHQGNTAAGYSATLFESLDHSGEYTFAIRGTEPLAGPPRGIFAKSGDNIRAQAVASARSRNEN